MYKLQVHSGMGDCLRIINNCRIVARCLREQTKCWLNYKVLKDEPWTHRNKATFLALVSNIPIFEYLDSEQFECCTFTLANSETDKKIYSAMELLPLPIDLGNTKLPHSLEKDKINIAVQPTGSTKHKAFSLTQLESVFKAFSSDKFIFHIIDRPEVFLKNNEMFAKYSGVVCRELNFNENYKLLTLCDLLIGPDSFSKYVMHAANKKMVVACSKLPYVTDINGMFKYAFAGIFDNTKVKIIGWQNTTDLVDKIANIPEQEIIEGVQSLLHT